METSLYESALGLGATDGMIEPMAEVFAYDVDFQRDVRPGDHFELVFERYYDDKGDTVRTGELSFVSLTTHGRATFYRFLAPGDRSPEWYDPKDAARGAF